MSGDADPDTSATRLEHCRVYKVVYSVRGRDKELISKVNGVCVIAKDVTDLVDQINNIILGKEITINNGIESHHNVVEYLEIESAELIGRLHGVTEMAFDLIKKCGRQD